MKKFTFLLIAAVLTVLTSEAYALPEARVVRLVHAAGSTDWRLSVNSTNAVLTLRELEVTNNIMRLGLHQGDLILLGSFFNTNSSTWDWVRAYCESNKVAVYLYAPYAVSSSASIFAFPVYHWSTPYEYPRDLTKAAFFREGEFLGMGTNGFKSMLHSISETRPKKVFILGSLYDIYSGYGPNERPYEELQDLLDATLKKTSTESVILDPAFGF